MSGGGDPAQRIAAGLGEHLVAAGEPARAGFTVDGATPAAVAFPEEPEQVAALLALAAREGWGVVPWGGGSGMGRGNRPARYDVAVSLSRLAQLLDHDVENLTLSGQAGLTVEQANRRVAGAFHMLAVALPEAPHTLGGVVAANRLAPKRLLYGEVRDQLLGLRVALPDGRLVRYGRKVLKNVAGYDMNKLFLGSQGMLGIVVEATFKLFARPDDEACLLAAFGQRRAALGAAARLYRSPLLPAFVYVLDAAAAASAYGAQRLEAPAGAAHVLAGFEGRPLTLRRQLADGEALLREEGATVAQRAGGLQPAVREVLDGPPAGDPPGAPGLLLRLGVLPTALEGLLGRLERALAELELAPAMLADYGAGQVRVALPAPEDGLAPRLAGLVTALREELALEHGFVVVERAPPACKDALEALGAGPGETALMRMLRARFDPHSVMAPGRYPAGPA